MIALIHIQNGYMYLAAASIAKDLESLTDWFRANKLSLNISKTNYMIFTNNPINIINTNLQINNEYVELVDSTKFLGMHIDNRLNWSKHTQICRNKISSGLYALRNVRHLIPRSHLKSLYYTLIHPYLNYNTLIWGSANKQHTKGIINMQNKAIRMITNSRYNESTTPLYESTNILQLENIYNWPS